MINNIKKITIETGIEYISDWKDAYGNYKMDRLLSGRVMVNKSVTGCGFTTYLLVNSFDVILVMPRLRLIQNKMEQFNEDEERCFYFNREKDKKGNPVKSFAQLEDEFVYYRYQCQQNRWPMKILVTYDSFRFLADMLEQRLQSDIGREFLIAVDESHCLIKDVKLKEYNNKSVLAELLSRLFMYRQLLFISATPIIDYVGCIPEFQDHRVDYIELVWSDAEQVISRTEGCKSVMDAFDKIYLHYLRNCDAQGIHYFDVKHLGSGCSVYSTEAVVFLNSVVEIQRILNKYVNKLGVIDPDDITIICADTKENHARMKKVGHGISIAKSIPKDGDPHTTWTFVTRTAFEGVDFYSPSASTFVVVNYHVVSLSLDIASDIPQIVGRQRRKDNAFRQIIHIYYTNNQKILDDAEFQAWREEKMRNSMEQICMCNAVVPQYKPLALKNLSDLIEANPDRYYVTTVNGQPAINQLLLISEDYCRDILKQQQHWFVLPAYGSALPPDHPALMLRDELAGISGSKVDRIRKVYEYFAHYQGMESYFFTMLNAEGHGDIAYYFNHLSPERIQSNGFNTTKMDREIDTNSRQVDLTAVIALRFARGSIYSLKEVKSILQEIYDSQGISACAKASQLKQYINCEVIKKGGTKMMRIV